MTRQQTLQERRQEQQLHQAHRQKKFHARQTDRTRPAAWQHSCRGVVVGHIRRQLDRINDFNAVVQDQLAAVGETLMLGAQSRLIIASSRDVSMIDVPVDDYAEQQVFDPQEAAPLGFSIVTL